MLSRFGTNVHIDFEGQTSRSLQALIFHLISVKEKSGDRLELISSHLAEKVGVTDIMIIIQVWTGFCGVKSHTTTML